VGGLLGASRNPHDIASGVAAAAAGDRAAFGDLYQRYARMVHGILLAAVPPQEAEDLVQDVFTIALDRLGELREPGAFGPWLAAIARNRGADHHRHARETLELPPDLEAPPDASRAEVQHLLGVVRSMPEAYRETLILRFVEGMTGPEIAERTGLAPDSVRVNLHRGVKLLRQRLGLGAP